MRSAVSGLGDATGITAAVCLLGLVCNACGGGGEAPPPPPKRLTAEERILQVGKTWEETTLAEGYLNEPDITFLRATDRMTLQLQQGARVALATFDRKELIRTPQAREFHCKVSGVAQAAVNFAWRVNEASLTVRVPAVSLRRACNESGYPHPTRVIDQLSAVYVLRGDRLVAVDPSTLHSVLLPGD